MARKNASAAEVRTWARQNIDLIPEEARAGLGENARGRIHPAIKKAFEKANPRKVYGEKTDAEKPKVTFKAVVLDSAGRKTTREVALTTAEARALLGHESGRKGRFNKSDLTAAYEAKVAAEVADQFNKAA